MFLWILRVLQLILHNKMIAQVLRSSRVLYLCMITKVRICLLTCRKDYCTAKYQILRRLHRMLCFFEFRKYCSSFSITRWSHEVPVLRSSRVLYLCMMKVWIWLLTCRKDYCTAEYQILRRLHQMSCFCEFWEYCSSFSITRWSHKCCAHPECSIYVWLRSEYGYWLVERIIVQ